MRKLKSNQSTPGWAIVRTKANKSGQQPYTTTGRKWKHTKK